MGTRPILERVTSPQGPPFDRHSREPKLPIAARAFDTIRGGHWWGYKIPPVLAVAYAGVVVFDVAPGGPVRTAQALLTVLAVAAYGFVLNDLTDIEADRLSGQPNRMAGLGLPARVMALLLPLALAVALATLSRDRTTAVLTGANLLLPTLYSVPPVRLKGRGALGAVADASGVHILPMALVAWAVTRAVPERADLVPAFIASALGWTGMLGLRGIVVHQAQGLAGDRVAHVRTFVASIGKERARHLVWRWIVPIEVVALLTFLMIVVPHSPVLAVTLVLFAAAELRQMQLGWTLPLFEPPGRSSERYRPLVNNAWYELWLPVALAVQVALVHEWGWAVLVGHVALFHRNLAERIRALVPLVTAPPASTGRAGAFDTYRPRGPVEGNALAGTRVFVTTPIWAPSGLTHWAGDLVRGLGCAGVDATVLLTEEQTPLVTIGEPRMTRPRDINVLELPVERNDNWGLRWAALGHLLHDASPSVLVITNDWRHSAIVPLLDERVIVVGVVLALDPLYEEQVTRLRHRWDLLVAGSADVGAWLHRLVPEMEHRIVTIPHGVVVPTELSRDDDRRDALPRLLVTGTSTEHSARALEEMLATAEASGRPWRLTVVDPDDTLASLCRLRAVSASRAPNRGEWGELYRAHHAILALDWSAERRRHLVEAMGHGVVPVVWGSLPPDAPFRAGVSGRSLLDGDPAAMSEFAAMLTDARRWEEKSMRARTEVVGVHYTLDQMVDAYIDRIAWAMAHPRAREAASCAQLAPPPALVGDIRIFGDEFTVSTAWGSFPDQWSADEFARAWGARRAAEGAA